MEHDHGSQDALMYAAQQDVIAALHASSDPDLVGRLERCTQARRGQSAQDVVACPLRYLHRVTPRHERSKQVRTVSGDNAYNLLVVYK